MTEAETTNPPPRRLTILLTEGSSISSRQALYALGHRHTIDVLDPSALCQCRFSRLVRRWYRCPSFAQEPCGYLAFLGERLRLGEYDVLIPPHEEVYLLSRVRDALAQRVALAIPDFDAVTPLISKLNFIALLQELQLPYPEAAIVGTRAELDNWSDFPRFLKLDTGTAGQGVQFVHDRGELKSALSAFEERGFWRDGTPLILQKRAAGHQSVAHAVFRRGELVGVGMDQMRLIGVGGSAVARQSCYHPIVTDHLRRIGQKLNWHGPLFLDFFFDEATGTPWYIEGNPRIGDTANAALDGNNLCQLWVDVVTNVDVRPSPLPLPPSTLASHQAFLILISRALKGANRHQLLDEIEQQLRGRGIYENSRDEMTRQAEDPLSLLPYLWIAGQLLVSPARAEKIVRGTVENYSLTAEAARCIREISLGDLVASLESKPTTKF